MLCRNKNKIVAFQEKKHTMMKCSLSYSSGSFKEKHSFSFFIYLYRIYIEELLRLIKYHFVILEYYFL